MQPLLVKDASVVIDGGLERLDVLSVDGVIAALGPELSNDSAQVIEGSSLTLGPGFVDIHTHGGGGSSFLGEDGTAVVSYSAWAPSVGVTGFLASTAGATLEQTLARLSALSAAASAAVPAGAEPLGVHLEGPFLNPVRRGAFDPAMFRAPEVTEVRKYLDAAAGVLRQVTIAPELPGALPIIHQLERAGVTVAMGHTDASTIEAGEGFSAGVSHVTHLFNAMRPFHHREAGAVAASLMAETVTCELIMDGVHVSPDTLRLAYRLLGPERTVAVTDNVSFAGTSEVSGDFEGVDITVARGAATRRDGTLVGSIQTMDQHFRNAIEFLGLDLPTAFRICSTNPAAVVGAGDRKGRIAVGHDADLVLFDDDLRLVATVSRGVLFQMTTR